MIIFHDVTKKFGARTVFDKLNFTVQPGEFISIVGNSGAGKTTIIKMILGIEHPSEGNIYVNDRNIREIDGEILQQYRRNIGVVLQQDNLIPNKTVFENIAFILEACGLPPLEVFERTQRSLNSMGITHLQDQFPSELSGGEQQLVALARATAHDPKLIIADEPTGNLDFSNATRVLEKLLETNLRGVPVILTTHNKPLVERIGQKVITI